MGMMSQDSLFWKIFEATGSPDMYLLFKNSLDRGGSKSKLHIKNQQ